MDLHRLAEERSLAYHRRVAALLPSRPELPAKRVTARGSEPRADKRRRLPARWTRENAGRSGKRSGRQWNRDES
jgi:hypothetical protein